MTLVSNRTGTTYLWLKGNHVQEKDQTSTVTGFHTDRTASPLEYTKKLQPTSLLSNDSNYYCIKYKERLQRYCHQTLLEEPTVLRERSKEGRLENSDPLSLELVYTHVMARHGDRTPANRVLNLDYPNVPYNCGVEKRGDCLGDDIWEGLNDFPPLVSLGKIRNAKLNLHPGKIREKCQFGDLTSFGFQQHLNLGSQLGEKYSKLLRNSDISTEIFVQSTDYRRTIRSAAAFLLGFLPDDRNIRETVAIHVSPGDLNRSPPKGFSEVYRSCKSLGRLRESERQRSDYYTPDRSFRWIHKKVSLMFNLQPASWTQIFDHVATRGCHSEDRSTMLPCTQSECVDCALGVEMFQFADWSMSTKYPPNSSHFAMLPFVQHSILGTMDAVITPSSLLPRYKILLTFSHDSTMTQLLQVIGFPIREWMPYASRLVFELWKPTSSRSAPVFFVRVLFNGQVMTHHLPFSNREKLVEFNIFKHALSGIDLLLYEETCEIIQ